MAEKVELQIEELPVLETERLQLRKLTIDDAEDMFAYASNPMVTRYVTWPTHEDIEGTRQYLHFVQEQYAKNALIEWGIVDKETGRLIGSTGFVIWNRNHNWGEIGYVLSEDYWGQGLVAEAVRAVLQFGFEEMGLNRIQADCMIENTGSERVMQKVGMSYEGIYRQKLLIKGAYRDLKMYAILKEDWLAK